MKRNGERAKMVSAGRMTATARADIGADNEPDREAWVWGCVQTCDDVRPSDDDLDWEFAFYSRLGHPTGNTGGFHGQERQEKD